MHEIKSEVAEENILILGNAICWRYANPMPCYGAGNYVTLHLTYASQ